MWKSASGSGGVGMAGILAPLAGKQISCGTGLASGYAKVDASGNPYTRFVYPGLNYDSGWVSGYTAAMTTSNYAVWGLPNLNVYSNGPKTCATSWPLN